MEKLHIAVNLNRQRVDKKGRCAVRIRTIISRKVTYYKTGINVLPEQFVNGEIIKHEHKVLLNRELRKQLTEIETAHLEGNSIKLTKTDFYTFSQKKIEQTKSRDSHGTWKHKNSYLNKVNTFRPGLQFAEITPSLMLDFENYCRGLGNKPTTVWSSIKFVKTMVNAALNDGVITGNPMRGYKAAAYVNPVREYLTDEEIEKIEKFSNSSKSMHLVKVAYWFLFGCYAGLRYNDIKKFDKKSIVNGRIILRTGKSKTDVSIKIHERLKKVLDKISPNVFTNQKMNDYLKIIAEKCGIDKNVTFHISRHSYSIHWLNHGGSMESLSKLLGHSKLVTTAIYGKVTNLRLDAEIDKVFALNKKHSAYK